ncbi:hypothetical protein ACFE04_028678 [Oxalis oulophora]
MSLLKRIELYEPYYYPPTYVRQTSILAPSYFPFIDDEDDVTDLFDIINPNPFQIFTTDLVQIDKTASLYSYKRYLQQRKSDLALKTLCDRVSALESSFDKLVQKKMKNKKVNAVDRKYTWTAEIKGGDVEKKYQLVAKIKGGGAADHHKKTKEKKKEALLDRSYKWTAEIKDQSNGIERKYQFVSSSGDGGKLEKKKVVKENENEKKEKVKKKKECVTRVVQIEDQADDDEEEDRRLYILRQAFAKRAGAIRSFRGKQKELSPEDAALMIQMTFRAYVIRRSKALRALRELAIAKSKLKELRALFNNFSYRRHISRDAEERQKFSEKIIVLLLTVDSIEGADLMVRSAKRSMVDELEAMLDVVDPQPPGQSVLTRRRTFDMPDGAIQKEIAEGVAEVVQMLQQEESSG